VSELPKGWVDTTVDKIAYLVSGKTPKNVAQFAKHTGSVPWVKVSDMTLPGNEQYVSKSVISFSESECKNLGLPIIPEGSVIFPKNGGAIATGKKRQTAINCSIDLNTMAVIPTGINKDFLFYWIQTIDLSKLSDGSVVPQINKSDIAPLYFPLPPLNEQRRIVAKLDRLFARSRCAREELGRVSGLVQRYKQAILAAAFRGDLTVDWREKLGKLRKQWKNVSLDNLISFSQNGLSKRHGSDGQEIVVLRLADIKDYKVCLSEPRKIKLTKQEKDKYILQRGDILVVRVNGSKDIVGRLVLITEEFNAGYCDHFIRLSLISVCNPEYLSYHGNSERFRKYISENIVSSAGQNTVSQGTLKNYVLEMPCLEEQKEIVKRVERLFKTIDLIEQEHQQASKLLDRLEQATLSKAFRGELVPQDPNDEPAAVLLERIQSDRQAQPKGKAVKSKQSHR